MATRFEERGVQFQLQARTQEEADRSYNYSCDCCNCRGMRIDCDRCAIKEVHRQMTAIFQDNALRAQLENARRQDRNRDRNRNRQGTSTEKAECDRYSDRQ